MAEGLLSLSWNNHSATFCHALSSLRAKERYADVTLSCEGKFYSVHKLVLSTCSEYFENIFEQTPCKHPIIVLSNIQQIELEAILSYMYDGAVTVSQTNLPRLIKVAELLQIKGLAVPDEPPKSSSASLHRRQSQDSSSGRNSPLPRTKSNHSSSEASEDPQPKRIRREIDLAQDNPLESPASLSNSQHQEDSVEFMPEEKYVPDSETIAEAESESQTLASSQEKTPEQKEPVTSDCVNMIELEMEVSNSLQSPSGSDTQASGSSINSDMSQMSENENPWPYMTKYFRFKGRQGNNVLFECMQCVPLQKVISTSHKSRNNLKKHLESKHSYSLQEFETCVMEGSKAAKMKKRQAPHLEEQPRNEPGYDIPKHFRYTASTLNLVATTNANKALDKSTFAKP